MADTLYTNGITVNKTAADFSSYDKIAVSASDSTSPVRLEIGDGGTLDLTGALEGVRAATVYASDAGNTITGGAKADTLWGATGADTLNGGDGNDTIYGSSYFHLAETAADILNGGAGDDTIVDYGGVVSIDGGTGADTIQVSYYGGVAGGIIDGGEGRDRLTYSGTTDFTRLTISNVEVLETGGESLTATAAQFSGFDKIAVADDPGYSFFDVSLTLSGAGSLDLTKSLEGARGAMVYASADGNTITGGTRADTLYGGTGADTLNGGDGEDTLYGNSHDQTETAADILNGGAGGDTIFDYGGVVSIDGGEGDDRIQIGYDFGATGATGVTGGTVDGGEGEDVLSVDDTCDLSLLTIRNVELLVTGGFDIKATAAQFSAFNRIAVLEDGSFRQLTVSLTLSGTGSLDLTKALGGERAAIVHASDAGNSITGGAKADTLYGGAGNDTLNGAAGHETLNGGAGRDTLFGGMGDDTIDGGEGEDTAVFVNKFATYSINRTQAEQQQFTVSRSGDGTDKLSNVETGQFADGLYDFKSGTFTKNLIIGYGTISGTVAELESYDIIRGSASDPSVAARITVTSGGALDLSDELGSTPAIVQGSAAGNAITTGGGNDRLIQSFGALDAGATTSFTGGAGTDTLELKGGAAAITSTVLSDGSIAFTADGRTVVVSGVERFVVTGSSADDSLIGSAGNDWLDGQGGADTYRGSAGDDGYVFNAAGDRVTGEVAGGGTDSIYATVSVDLRQQGEIENLRLQAGDITGTGNGLDNLITGSAGRNVIAGGLGKDSLYGKGGADTFAFAEFGAANRDSIWDFGADDRVQLDTRAFSGLTATSGGFLDAADLSMTGRATTAEAQVIYNRATGVLAFDADGTGQGAAQDIAVIGKNLAFFDSSDIILV